MMRILWLILASVLSIPSLTWAAAETLYVRPVADCSFNGDGSAYACAASGGAPGAWSKHSNIIMNSSDETAGQLDPGDTLKVCGSFRVADRTTANYQIFFTVSGAANNLITVDGDCSANGGSATADFNGGTSTLYGFGSDSQTHLTIKNLVIHDFTSRGMLLYGDTITDITIAKHITIEDVTIRDIRGSNRIGVDARGRYITLTRMTVANVGGDAIYQGGGHHFIVQDATISGVSLDTGNGGDGVQMGDEVGGSVIRDSHINMTSVDSKYCGISSGVTDGGLVSFTGNTCVRNSTDTVGSGFYVENPAMIRSNSVTGGLHGIQCASPAGNLCEIVGNLIINANSRGIITGSTTTVVRVLNNTVIGATECIHLGANNAGIIASNNICQGQTTGINKELTGGAPVDTYNLFYQISGNNLVVNGTPTAPGTGSLLATNPLFVVASDYRTRASSPARRAGTPSGYCIDARGRACYPDRPDIGAYQATSGDEANTRTARQ